MRERAGSIWRRPLMPVLVMMAVYPLAACAQIELGAQAVKSATRAISGTDTKPATTEDAAFTLAQAQTTPEPLSSQISRDMVPEPSLFSATGDAVWDGKRTLQGFWAAHPDATTARRVRIVNEATGIAVDGALFRRDIAIDGAPILVSSDAARALGLQVGLPASLSIVALRPRRSDDPVAETEGGAKTAPDGVTADPVAETQRAGEASQDTPTPATAAASTTPAPDQSSTEPQSSNSETSSVPQTTSAPRESAALSAEPAAAEPAAAAQNAVAAQDTVAIPRPRPAQRVAAPAPTRPDADIARPYIQVGTFGSEANLQRLTGELSNIGLAVVTRPFGGNAQLTRLLVGPFEDVAARDGALQRIKQLDRSLADAYPVAR